MGGLDYRTLESGQDAWHHLREWVRYKQEEPLGDSLKALQS